MKNYLYKFRFISGFYEDYFFKQVKAETEKEAIIEIVSYFINTSIHKANRFIAKSLGFNWTPEKFWEKLDTKFFSKDELEAFELLFVKEIHFDLDRV